MTAMSPRKHSKDGSEDIFYTEYILKIAESLANMGYGLLLENFHYESGSKKIPKIVAQKRVDGVIVVGSLYTKGIYPAFNEVYSHHRCPWVSQRVFRLCAQ